MYVLLPNLFLQPLCKVQNVTDKIFLKALGKRIRTIRIKKGFSQLDVAARIDNYAEQVSRIERGLQNVTICTLKNIAESLEVTLAELLTVEKE